MSDDEIYERLREPLMRFAVSLVGPHEAHDLVSEAVVATLRTRSLASLDDPRAYLMRALVNRANSRWRRVAREQRALGRLTPAGAAELTVASDLVVRDAVAVLPPRQRAAIYLVYWEGLSPQQAAGMLGVREGTLRRYLHLARTKLRSQLDGQR